MNDKKCVDRVESEAIEKETDNQTRFLIRGIAVCTDAIVEAINKNTEKVSELTELVKPLIPSVTNVINLIAAEKRFQQLELQKFKQYGS